MESINLENALKDLKYVDEYGQPLLEMSMTKMEAIDRCEILGKRFIEHFRKIACEPNSQARNHWCNEMQGWMNSVNGISLKHNKKLLSTADKLNWFIDATSSPEYIFKGDSNLIDLYEQFTEHLIDSKWDVKIAIDKTFSA